MYILKFVINDTIMKVSDADEGRNAAVTLRVTAGNEAGRFRIDPESGVLFVAR